MFLQHKLCNMNAIGLSLSFKAKSLSIQLGFLGLRKKE